MNAGLCPVCGAQPVNPCLLSGPDRLHGSPGVFCIAECSRCGAGWTLPRADADELGRFYPSSYGAYVREQGAIGAVQRAGQRVLIDYALTKPPLNVLGQRTPGRLLDVGCGRGDLGSAFARRGWQVTGIDPSPAACELARSRGIDAHVGTLASADLADAGFDAVVLTHALEHVPDPHEDLVRINRLLVPGGLVVITVPNFASWQRDRFGVDWFPLDLPRHRTHFTGSALTTALVRAGFSDVSVRAGSDAGSAFLASLQYRFVGRQIATRGPAAWMGYAFAPINRLLDLALGQGALLHGVARRAA